MTQTSRIISTEGRLMYPMPTTPLNEDAHVAYFWPVLPVNPCPFTRLPCFIREKVTKMKNTQNVAWVLANATGMHNKLLISRAYSHVSYACLVSICM